MRAFDSSSLSVINLGESFEVYSIEEYETFKSKRTDSADPLFQYDVMQSRKRYKTTYAVVSLDMILGMVGGITSVIWGMLAILISPYQDFALQQSLLGSIYPTSPQLDEDRGGWANLKEATWALKQTVSERGQFTYTFWEYYGTWFFKTCCCCFLKKQKLWWRRREWRYNRYEDILERMNSEIDVLKFISAQRMTDFLSKVYLSRH